MILNIFLILLVILLLLWTVCAIGYYQQSVFLQIPYQRLLQLLELRLNTLPLLISLMTPHVVKSEDVFRKSLQLHQTLLFYPGLEKEAELSRQITFLFQVAEKHPSLLADKAFQKTSQELAEMQKKILATLDQYNDALRTFQQLRRKSLWVLFPGYFLFSSLKPLDRMI